MHDPVKLEQANQILKTFAPDTSIEWDQGKGFMIVWPNNRRLWRSKREGSFYPAWHKRWPHGGTAIAALAQLIFWLRGNQSVCPLRVWQAWASDTYKLATPETIELLKQAEWPVNPPCVKCGKPIALYQAFDWFTLDSRSGCGHGHLILDCERIL